MEKVILTKKQADAVEYFKKEHQENLGDMSLRSFYDALRCGYEVEPEFEIGQWIVLTSPFTSAKITARILDIDVGGDNRIRLDRDDHCWWDKEDIRPATPSEIAEEKERRFFAGHGRGVLEFKTNDIVSYDCNSWGGIYIVSSDNYSKDAFGNRLVKVFNKYMHSGKTLSFRADELKVICFAEERLDVKTIEK